jgi:hypothetical protein
MDNVDMRDRTATTSERCADSERNGRESSAVAAALASAEAT